MRDKKVTATTIDAATPVKGRRPSTLKNVTTSWVWQMIVLISGFILPRQIDIHLGPELLGVWDFGWSWVFYVRNLHMGISASVNRYTARHRALQDWAALNETLNVSIWLMAGMALLGSVLAAGFAMATPMFLPKQSAEVIIQAQWVVFILGVSSAQQLIGSVFDAGLAGFERWDLLNWLRGARDIFLIVTIVALLYAGFGLVATSLVVLIGHVLCDGSLFLVLRRLFPQLHLSPWRIRRQACAELILFGGKTVVREVLRGAVYQINGVYVSGWLGLGALAVFSRQRTLLTHLITFIKQYAHVFVPASSALHATSDKDALRKLLIRSSEYGFFVSLPPLVVLLFAGGEVIDLWMGPGYRSDAVLAILTLCHIPLISQLSVYAVLVGMDRHGRAVIYEFFSALTSIALGYILVGVAGFGLMGAAVAIGVPLLIVGGVILPLDACRTLGLSPVRYAAATLPRPFLMNLPFAAVLLAAEWMWPNRPMLSLLAGGSIGGIVLVAVYWKWVLPESMRERLRILVNRRLGQRASNRDSATASAAETLNSQSAQ